MNRLDVYLCDNKFFTSREKAKREIKAKNVKVNGAIITKPATIVSDEDKVEVIGLSSEFVGRGGEKLKKALIFFHIDLNKKAALDIGSSTGGFTHCMLLNNIDKVYALDVGTDQLDNSLRINDKVVVMEKTDIRSVDKETFKEDIDFISVDVSFISINKIADKIFEILSEDGDCILLIKPQFECGKYLVGKNGVVKDKNTHIQVLNKIDSELRDIGFYINNATFSPIKGKKGNIEYLLHISKKIQNNNTIKYDIIVKETFKYFVRNKL